MRVRDFSAKSHQGFVNHTLVLKVPTNTIRLDLKKMSVDSVYVGSTFSSFTHLGESLNILLPKSYTIGDTLQVRTYYQGNPAADPSGWGGFYFSGDNAFNLGVGFAVFPHSFGRAWMPCVDEFDMKSSYEFFIETDTDFVAACNGLLLDVNSTSEAKVWHYLETVPMSAYLAAISVSRYQIFQDTFSGMNAQFPVQIFHKASDSLKVRKSFANLPNAIRFFEESFGPQPYSKVGYNLVPFSSGAMEHAGNITYPLPYVNGSTDYETLMAHELSHHWWGNLVTCRDAGDMWLNEGWASYCEHLFTEKLYGRLAYDASIMQNHQYVLRYAHVIDAQIYSLTNIPETVTYGTHVYKKGADVVHSLRGVLGDSLFFRLCKVYQDKYRLSNASSIDMQKLFRDSGGAEIAFKFFDHFVLDKGFPHIIISKQIHSGNGPFHIKLFTTQSPRFKTTPYQLLPVEIRFFKDKSHFIDTTILVNSILDSFEFDLPFKPLYVGLDSRALLSDAITDKFINLSTIGNYTIDEAYCKLIVNKVVDTSLVRVEHHWVGPERFVTTYPRMSNYRYLTIDGVWDDSLDMDLELTYDGRMGSTSGNVGYLDHTLIFKTEDSLCVMYRAFPGDYWSVWNDFELIPGNKNDKQGKLILKHVKKGDYVPAMKDINLGIYTESKAKLFDIKPNPSSQYFTVYRNSQQEGKMCSIQVMDMNGNVIHIVRWDKAVDELNISTSDWPSGNYIVWITCGNIQESIKISVIK
ncbi:MAG: T9SS type A sorting domain-containing protein [Bacteroidia bacterium]|nr:T9SS type A sorting domain-containing protein [Bacteroidia bacterium]